MVIGEEITAEIITPIAFIGREVKKSKIILKLLEKSIAWEIGSSVVKREQLVEHFVNPDTRQINVNKLVKAIDNIINECNSSRHADNEKLIPVAYTRKDIISQLILHEIVTRHLNQKNEVLTKQAFERLKSRWISFVVPDKSSPCIFVINKAKLDHECEAVISDPNVSQNTSAEVLSQSSHQLSMDLLSNAIVTHAFRQHSLNIESLNVQIKAREKVGGTTSCLDKMFHFLKLDLYSTIFTDDSRIGFGITWEVVEDVLYFAGIPDSDIKGRKIVIQIISRPDLILRELRFNGRSKDVKTSVNRSANRSTAGTQIELQQNQSFNNSAVL